MKVLERERPGDEPFRLERHNSPAQGNNYDCGVLTLWNIQRRLSVEHPLTEEDHQQWTPDMPVQYRGALLLARLRNEKVALVSGHHETLMDLS